ncbi:MAG: cobyric acid synthase CobQ [Cuniculiplasma sp. C_DKE]|nr:MAG: cobyric acid synthase CobQ [Cuniculiplasma sp. C_DKE]
MSEGKLIHIMGTSSNAGKSTITMGICRILSDMGYSVSPFKAMNMSLNSISTPDGYEISRSQWLQAKASRTVADWKINPILLKPEGSGKSQVIFMGKSIGSRTIEDYGKLLRDEARSAVREALKSLLDRYDVVVAEGSGSAAEINLYDRDLANTWLTSEFKGTGILVTNIENGGAFSSLYGTKSLAQFPEVLKYFIINNMRGSTELLRYGIEKISSMTGMLSMGVIPHMENSKLPGEDSLDYSNINGTKVGIIRYPYFENYSDIDPLIQMGLGKYITSPEQLETVDSILLPGSKNVYEDLDFIIKTGLGKKITEFHEKGLKIIGICGGYQILSRSIKDPGNVQLPVSEIKGLGLLDTDFIYNSKKEISEVKYEGSLGNLPITGTAYFIHYGREQRKNDDKFVNTGRGPEGSISSDGKIIGTNLHGILENSSVFHWFTGLQRSRSYEETLEDNIQSFSRNLSVNLKRELLMQIVNGT